MGIYYQLLIENYIYSLLKSNSSRNFQLQKEFHFQSNQGCKRVKFTYEDGDVRQHDPDVLLADVAIAVEVVANKYVEK